MLDVGSCGRGLQSCDRTEVVETARARWEIATRRCQVRSEVEPLVSADGADGAGDGMGIDIRIGNSG